MQAAHRVAPAKTGEKIYYERESWAPACSCSRCRDSMKLDYQFNHPNTATACAILFTTI